MKPNLFSSSSTPKANKKVSDRKPQSETKEIIFLSSGLLALMFGIGGMLMYSEDGTVDPSETEQVEEVRIAKAFSTPKVDAVSLPSSKESPPEGVVPQDVTLSTEAIPSPIEAPQETEVYFSLNGTVLSDEAKTQIQQQLDSLPDGWEGTVRIEGHTDPQGTETYNQSLGLKRAETVQQYVVDRGLSDDKIQITSLGETSPLCQEQEESCYSQNRRVHLTFFPEPPVHTTETAFLPKDEGSQPNSEDTPSVSSPPSLDSGSHASSPTADLQEELVASEPLAPAPDLP